MPRGVETSQDAGDHLEDVEIAVPPSLACLNRKCYEEVMIPQDHLATTDLSELLERYSGTPVATEDLSRYERFALEFFHRKEIISDPNLELTVQLDITEANRIYRKHLHTIPGASLTACLSWCVLQAMKHHPEFRYRKIEGQWYQFDNLPLFFPVAVGSQERFNEVLLEGVCQQTLPEFCTNYRTNIDAVLTHQKPYDPIPFETWHIAHFIGNLPNIQFTHLSTHRSTTSIGRPIFYFGKRYTTGEHTFAPFFIQFDHCNLDPYVVGRFLESLQEVFTALTS